MGFFSDDPPRSQELKKKADTDAKVARLRQQIAELQEQIDRLTGKKKSFWDF